MSLSDFIQTVTDSGHVIEVAGFINVEGGSAAVSSRFFNYCDCTQEEFGPKTRGCEVCSRQPGNWASIPSGDGDGVFVVAKIINESASKRVVGAFAVFDYKYQIPNAVRSQIANETIPLYPVDLVRDIKADLHSSLGSIENSGRLLFGDSSLSTNSVNAIVDVEVDASAELECFTFLESVDGDWDAWAERLAKTQGMDPSALEMSIVRAKGASKAAFEMAARASEESLPSFVPRCIVVLDKQLAETLGLKQNVAAVDWVLAKLQFEAVVVTAHKVPQYEMCVWQNAMLALEHDRAAGDVDYETGKKLLFDVWTWCYQGVLRNDQDCIKFITSNAYKASADETAQLLRRRGLTQAAHEVLEGKSLLSSLSANPDVGDRAPVSTATLGKSSSGLGSQAEDADSKVSVAAFCGMCGNPREGAVNFCPHCGVKF